MKRLIYPLLFTLAACSKQPIQVTHIHDGDTFTIHPYETVRIANIDAPELPNSPSCFRVHPGWCNEPEKAMDARKWLYDFTREGITFHRVGYDKYGRTLAIVYADGVDVGEAEVKAGLARRWK